MYDKIAVPLSSGVRQISVLPGYAIYDHSHSTLMLRLKKYTSQNALNSDIIIVLVTRSAKEITKWVTLIRR